MTFLLPTRVACNSRGCAAAALLPLLLFFCIVSTSHTNKFNKHEELSSVAATVAASLPPAPCCLPAPLSHTDHVIDALIRILTAVIAVAFAGNMPPGRASAGARARAGASAGVGPDL